MTRRPTGSAGFTLIELMVVVALLAVLMALAMPSMSMWIKNSAVRASSDALQNGLRMAQADAVSRSRQTVFSLTNDAAPQTSFTAAANGKYWAIKTIGIQGQSTDVAQFVQAGVIGNPGNAVQITGPAAICFNSLGRLTTNTSTTTGVGADCAAADNTYLIELNGADRPLRVTVAIGGQVRMCDPAKTLSATHPDGC